MRRILLLLPLLALAACQSDLATDPDGVRTSAGSPATAGLQAILQDWIVDTRDEVLEFVVINPPAEFFLDCSWSGAKLSTRPHPASEPAAVLANAEHPQFCTLTNHWESVTSGDDEPDLKVHFVGGEVCRTLAESGASPVTLEVKLKAEDVNGPLFLVVVEDFIVRCPYLSD